MHRAINRSGVRRYSIPLFFGTDYDVKLEVRVSSCSARCVEVDVGAAGAGPANPELCVARPSVQIRGRDRRGLRKGAPQGGVRALKRHTVTGHPAVVGILSVPFGGVEGCARIRNTNTLSCTSIDVLYVQSSWNANKNSAFTCRIPTWALACSPEPCEYALHRSRSVYADDRATAWGRDGRGSVVITSTAGEVLQLDARTACKLRAEA